MLDAAKPMPHTVTAMQVTNPSLGLQGTSYYAAHWASTENGELTFATDQYYTVWEPGTAGHTFLRQGSSSLVHIFSRKTRHDSVEGVGGPRPEPSSVQGCHVTQIN